ncbi:MAG: glycosyltransferase family 2 protein [Thermoanaerobaculia bacterium]|nr:glycosyltransferase family 2 protein [Thermoanaerobaculia bacterium]
MTDLSLILLHWNRPGLIRGCLERLRGWDRAGIDVWVVDNGSRTSPDSLRAALPAARWLPSERNLGFGGGNNLALRRAAGRYLLLMNPDAVMEEGDARRLLSVLDRRPDLFAVGPLIVQRWSNRERVTAGGRDIGRYPRTHQRLDELPPGTRDSREPIPVRYVPGTAVLLRRREAIRLGGFDEAYFFAGEMADLCERARAAGLSSAVLPSARAEHDMEEAGTGRTDLYPYYILRNRFLFVRRHRRLGRFPLLAFWSAYGLAKMSQAVARGDHDRGRALGLAVLDGLRGRYGGANRRVLRSNGQPPGSGAGGARS